MKRAFRRIVTGGAILAGLLVLARIAVWGTVALTGAGARAEALREPPVVVEWHARSDDFGGLSGLLVLRDGGLLLAVGDRGRFFEALVTREPGAPPVIGHTRVIVAPSHVGESPPEEFHADLEAITLLPDGRLGLAYEGYTRLQIAAQAGAVPEPTHRWDRFEDLFGNSAFEALATLPDGRMLAIRETGLTSSPLGGPAPTVIHEDGQWVAGPPLPVSYGYAVTGADVGPDGCLYVVERRFDPVSGFTFGVWRHGTGADGAARRERIYRSPPARYGDAEGISAWTEPGGGLVLSLVTDNNFWPQTPTRLIELRPRPAAPCAAALPPAP